MIGFRHVLGHAKVLCKAHEMYGNGCYGVTDGDADAMLAMINVLSQFTERELAGDQMPAAARICEIERKLGMPKAELQSHLAMIQDLLCLLQKAEPQDDDDASEA